MNRQWLTALSLAPLLGATQTLLNASAIAGLSVLLIALHHLAMGALQRWLTARGRVLASVLLAATLVTCLELSLRAWALPLYQALSPYPALIAVQCLIFEQAQGEKRRWSETARLLAGFAALCIALGICREVLANWAEIRLAALLPGAFLLLGLLLALYNRVCLRRAPSRRQGTR
ncbi:Rnf-Nqr domain containing protein [Pseudomonas sp. H9]|uniref:Rnf-Nqr domain containing protein n=1 Tax=Pseudomonas sp. H9 TaxID=483968 RepID=UPI0010576588|nr:Rnf-Nqr domain containing protein [Pseudomonas sp. H9]TDF82772.1 NADH:quinone oxidoreductase [Pseudomonas sp. H9]